jgi:hypothetical protein
MAWMADGPARRAAAARALSLLLIAAPAAAEEWHEAYRAGLAALERGEHAVAAERLRRAIALRPEPGRNVVTYGTNVEPRYYPYLRLAEACLALGQLDAAREALATSAARGREPAEERQRLLARLEAALEQRRPAPTTTTTLPAATPTPAAVAPPATTPAPTPTSGPTATPAPTPAAGAAESPAGEPARRQGLRPPPEARPAPATAPSATPAGAPAPQTPRTGTLEIVSQPPGAAAYLDDEPIGSTDPETGRIVRPGVAAGMHRVRVSHAGHEDAVRLIEVPRGGNASFYATLKPVPAATGRERAGWLAFGAVALALVAVVAWIALRPAARQPSPIWAPTPRSARTPIAAPPTPPGHANPGARRDELGQEWFGDYRLLEMLGRGGMASVYKAERRAELSALKRPLGSFLDDPEFLERFLREAEISRTINHPNIVRILERGEVERVPYFTMELLPGETLQAFIRNWGAAEPRTAASIVVQVAEALDFAHSKGVVHRDLKPSNIMLLTDGTAKVMDFGIARARRFEGLTTTGAFLGTPDYVAPETIEGRGTEPRSDLYALGVVFYELLTGERPFSGDTPFAILRKHCTEEPAPPTQIDRRVPQPLEAITLRLLRKSPEGRPASAEELVVTLRDWLNRAA